MNASLPLSTRLDELARNLWWSWDPAATALFERLDPGLWRLVRQNPVAFLAELDVDIEPEAAAIEDAHGRMQSYLSDPDTWAHRYAAVVAHGVSKPIVYLSMEFGLHESVRIYSGGLGVLAGDHVRSASDLGLAFVGVGLLYGAGYFRQVVDDGRQIAAWPQLSAERLPIRRLTHDDGRPVQIEVPDGKGSYRAEAWELQVGRARLLLLDADLTDNRDDQREITRSLYGGDHWMRIRQEILLGIGGMRLLQALGIDPAVVHLNEGHCAFAPLELMRQSGGSFDSALAQVRDKVVFTTHTPVPAGHDRFGWDMVDELLGAWRDDAGWYAGRLMDTGREDPSDLDEPLCMTVLAMRTARKTNGVSALHGAVSRSMFAALELPIGHVTNGVHPTFWMAPQTQALLDTRAPGWRVKLTRPAPLTDLEALSDADLWSLRRALKEELLREVAVRAGVQLDPTVLTIGFARRFAPYKRANLLFSDPERLARLVQGGRLQILYAGKAHPRDTKGQALVAEVLRWSRDRRFRDRVVFLPNYEIDLGRALTRGVDVWLNNPRRPREASGTSGQKVALNGGLNASVLDGWWPEAYDGDNGWAIGDEREYEDLAQQDAADAESLYRVIEEGILPAWEARTQGVPTEWTRRMRHAMATCIPAFNTHRMVADYVEQVYLDKA